MVQTKQKLSSSAIIIVATLYSTTLLPNFFSLHHSHSFVLSFSFNSLQTTRSHISTSSTLSTAIYKSSARKKIRNRNVSLFSSHSIAPATSSINQSSENVKEDFKEGFQASENSTVAVTTNRDDIEAFKRSIGCVLNELRTGNEDPGVIPALFSNKENSITRVWDLSMWKQHTSRFRYCRHFFGLINSRLWRRTLPPLSACMLWAFLSVQVLTNSLKVAKTHYVPFGSLSMISSFVGFCLTLRSNMSLARLSEARELWGRMFIVTRDTAQLLVAYAYPKDKELGLSAARYLSILPWLMRGHLRDVEDTDIIDAMLTSSVDRSYLTSQRKKPAATIARIRQVVANLAARNVLPIPAQQQLETNLHEMNYILGMCERLRGSPIPPVYTSHTSRLLVFYLMCLPLALHGLQMKKAVTLLVTASIGYTMLGLDEISHTLEQPFRLMPLHQLSRNMMMDVGDAFVCQPPNLKVTDAMPIGNISHSKEEVVHYPYNENNTQPEYW